MKVSEKFSIDEDVLYTRAQGSEYWFNTMKFYNQVKDKEIDTLSSGQLSWLGRVEDDIDAGEV